MIQSAAGPVDDPFNSRSSGVVDAPEATTPLTNDESAAIEFPSEPTAETPFGDAPSEEANQPVEDPNSEPMDGNSDTVEGDTTEEGSDLNEDPFGG